MDEPRLKILDLFLFLFLFGSLISERAKSKEFARIRVVSLWQGEDEDGCCESWELKGLILVGMGMGMDGRTSGWIDGWMDSVCFCFIFWVFGNR